MGVHFQLLDIACIFNELEVVLLFGVLELEALDSTRLILNYIVQLFYFEFQRLRLLF